MGHKEAAGEGGRVPVSASVEAGRMRWEPSPLARADIRAYSGARLEVREKEAGQPRTSPSEARGTCAVLTWGAPGQGDQPLPGEMDLRTWCEHTPLVSEGKEGTWGLSRDKLHLLDPCPHHLLVLQAHRR